MVKTLLISSLFFLYSLPALACSCVWAGKFSDVSQNTPLIVRGRVQHYGPALPHGENLYENMTIDIVDIVRGQYEHQTLKILGDPGYLCRPYISSSTFPVEGEFLFALQQPQQQTVPLSGCGEYFVPAQ